MDRVAGATAEAGVEPLAAVGAEDTRVAEEWLRVAASPQVAVVVPALAVAAGITDPMSHWVC